MDKDMEPFFRLDYLKVFVEFIKPVGIKSPIFKDGVDGLYESKEEFERELNENKGNWGIVADEQNKRIFKTMGIKEQRKFKGNGKYISSDGLGACDIVSTDRGTIIELKGFAFKDDELFNRALKLTDFFEKENLAYRLERLDVSRIFWRKRSKNKPFEDYPIEPFKGLLKAEGFWPQRVSVSGRFCRALMQEELAPKNSYSAFTDENSCDIVCYSMNDKIFELGLERDRATGDQRKKSNQARIDDFEKKYGHLKKTGNEVLKLEMRFYRENELDFLLKKIKAIGAKTEREWAKEAALYFYEMHPIAKLIPNGPGQFRTYVNYSFGKFFMDIVEGRKAQRNIKRMKKWRIKK